jgi:hypothetical protein
VPIWCGPISGNPEWRPRGGCPQPSCRDTGGACVVFRDSSFSQVSLSLPFQLKSTRCAAAVGWGVWKGGVPTVAAYMEVTGAFAVLTSRCGLHCLITAEGCAV